MVRFHTSGHKSTRFQSGALFARFLHCWCLTGRWVSPWPSERAVATAVGAGCQRHGQCSSRAYCPVSNGFFLTVHGSAAASAVWSVGGLLRAARFRWSFAWYPCSCLLPFECMLFAGMNYRFTTTVGIFPEVRLFCVCLLEALTRDRLLCLRAADVSLSRLFWRKLSRQTSVTCVLISISGV